MQISVSAGFPHEALHSALLKILRLCGEGEIIEHKDYRGPRSSFATAGALRAMARMCSNQQQLGGVATAVAESQASLVAASSRPITVRHGEPAAARSSCGALRYADPNITMPLP